MIKLSGNAIYLSLVRFWLVTILVMLPFQLKIATYVNPWSSRLSTIINNLDELTIAALLLLALGEIYKNKTNLNTFFFYSYL